MNVDSHNDLLNDTREGSPVVKRPTIGDPQDQKFIDQIKTPRLLKRSLLRVYQQEYKTVGRRNANLSHLKRIEMIREVSNGLRLSTNDYEIKEQAKFHVNILNSLLTHGINKAALHINSCGIPFPWSVAKREANSNGGYVTCDGPTAKRLTNDKWMVRVLRKEIRRRIESIALNQGVIDKKTERYSSDQTVLIHEQQRDRNRQLLEAMEAVNEEGESLSLLELSELSVSNPYIRHSELMVRLRGFENYADNHDHIGDIWTLTCPSKFHRSSKKWNGSTPKDAQKWLCQQWAKFRSAMNRAGLTMYGFRVAEPHKDACPHWHLLLFFETTEAQNFARECMFKYMLQEDGDEPGALKHRFDFMQVDKQKGSATGYLAKYITKNIDGKHIDDIDGRDSQDSALRTNTWASNWGIRQFQQIGGPSVTVWRELRRMETEEEGVLEDCRKAADTSDWCKYFEAQGGHKANYHDMPVKPAYWIELDSTISEIPTNDYGEPKCSIVFGVIYKSVYYLTRLHTWKIHKIENTEPVDTENYNHNSEGNELISSGSSLPWSSVNNCTQ